MAIFADKGLFATATTVFTDLGGFTARTFHSLIMQHRNSTGRRFDSRQVLCSEDGIGDTALVGQTWAGRARH